MAITPKASTSISSSTNSRATSIRIPVANNYIWSHLAGYTARFVEIPPPGMLWFSEANCSSYSCNREIVVAVLVVVVVAAT